VVVRDLVTPESDAVAINLRTIALTHEAKVLDHDVVRVRAHVERADDTGSTTGGAHERDRTAGCATVVKGDVLLESPAEQATDLAWTKPFGEPLDRPERSSHRARMGVAPADTRRATAGARRDVSVATPRREADED